MSKKRRSDSLSVTFVNGMCKGWVFGVWDAFRMNLDIKYALDIKYDKRIDTRRIGGLSPFARGNRLAEGQANPRRGPIPARAGEPFFDGG